MASKYCFACDRKTGKNPLKAITSDGQIVYIGSECYKMLTPQGWQPPKGGPMLYRVRFAPDGKVVSNG